MGSAPFEIIAGPANIWVAAVGTAFPNTNAVPGGSFTALGKTDGGVRVRHGQNVELIRYDQGSGPVKAIRSEEMLDIEFSMMELTLEKIAKALNNVTVTTDAGPPATKRITTYQGLDVSQYVLLVRGPSPYFNGDAQYQVPVAVQIEEPEVEYSREDKALLAVKFTALEDPAAASAAERFGRLVAQTA